jgi:hypothetical protein
MTVVNIDGNLQAKNKIEVNIYEWYQMKATSIDGNLHPKNNICE